VLYRLKEDLPELSSLGHFLKGSSATLGFNKVRDSCQVIQQYGHQQTLDGSPEADKKVCLQKITDALQTVKDDMAKVEKLLREFFGEGSD
jgi:osomolarity two-component system phosphorelay intermediate protein YPD1